jgi:bacillopeptidase F (M6 metalloprotease family)
LRFWHWWSISSNDFGIVQVSTDNGTTWTDLSSNYVKDSSGEWTRATLDLSAYAGQTIQLGFYFESHTDGYGRVYVGPGWYIDEVEVITGPLPQWASGGIDTFEDAGAPDRWTASNGIWEIGVPTSGPNAAHERTSLLATILSGNYTDNRSSRVVSPYITLPSADQNPRLRFWHWWSISSNDFGIVQVSTDNGTTWTDLQVRQ